MMKDKKPDDVAKGTAADPRFAAVQYDPRFQRFPKNNSKVQVDDRFKGKLGIYLMTRLRYTLSRFSLREHSWLLERDQFS